MIPLICAYSVVAAGLPQDPAQNPVVQKIEDGPKTGRPLLEELEHRAVNFFWDQSNPATGFSRDRATNAPGVDHHDVASSASVGFALVAYAIGAQHRWLDRKNALERTRITMKALNEKWPHSHGWLYHFIDYNTGARVWQSEASSIDTSICLAGILAAQMYWHDAEIDAAATAFVKRIDWSWMLTDDGHRPNEVHLSMGWHPESNFIAARWNDYNEGKMLYIQAYGASDIPSTGWDRIKRPELSYNSIPFIQGGPLFMHEMSEAFYGFAGLRDRLGFDYAVSEKNAALANREYCIDNPKHFAGYGPTLWGLSACDSPSGYNAFGAPGWISDEGTITPTSAVASLPVLPKEALEFAEAMRRDHPEAWGKYGFPNGFCPQQKWVDPDVIGIDLGMMMCGIENAQTGMVWKLSSANPIVRRGYDRAGLHKAKADPRIHVPSLGLPPQGEAGK